WTPAAGWTGSPRNGTPRSTASRPTSRKTSADGVERARSPQLEELDLEQQRGVGRDDAPRAARAVAEARRDEQGALAADLHARHPFVPALDDLPLAEPERERAPAVQRAVELASLGPVHPQPAGVVHHAGLARRRRG